MKKRFFDPIIDFMAFLAGLLLVLAVLIVCFEICMRYFVHKPQIWTVEICEYILFCIAFLGAPWLLKSGGHVNIDIVVTQLSAKGEAYLGIFATGAGVLVSAIICWFGITTSYECYESGVLITKALSVPKHYFLILIPLGYFFLMVEFAGQFVGYMRKIKGKK